MIYGIEDEMELLHLLGYLSKEQWEDALTNHNKNLDVGKIEEYKQEIEKFYKIKLD